MNYIGTGAGLCPVITDYSRRQWAFILNIEYRERVTISW